VSRGREERSGETVSTARLVPSFYLVSKQSKTAKREKKILAGAKRITFIALDGTILGANQQTKKERKR